MRFFIFAALLGLSFFIMIVALAFDSPVGLVIAVVILLFAIISLMVFDSNNHVIPDGSEYLIEVDAL